MRRNLSCGFYKVIKIIIKPFTLYRFGLCHCNYTCFHDRVFLDETPTASVLGFATVLPGELSILF